MRAIVLLGLVRRLLTLEAAGSRDQEALTEAAERVSDKLRVRLSKAIGQEGFRTLLARALALTTARFPHLSAVQVAADGSLTGLRGAIGPGPQETQSRETQQDTVAGTVALMAQFIELLVTFIGEDLTLRILSTVWPELTLDDTTDWED